MSLIHDKKLSTSFAYSKVEAIADFGVGALVRDHSPGLASQGSNRASTTARQTRQNIDRAEPCFITKRPSYALERAHWINTVRGQPVLKARVEKFLVELGIVHDEFNLNDNTNVTNLDPMLHVSLEKYGFFAVTASMETLRAIITLVEEQNRMWQREFDEGVKYTRRFYLQREPFSNAQYELVVLHPEHFLPKRSTLTLYTCVNDQPHGKDYVVGHDRTLREVPGTTDSPRFPAFTFDANRGISLSLNVFLVILNADIKFRRYRRMGTMPKFPEDVEQLIDETIRLVRLIYWKPERDLAYRQRLHVTLPAMDVDVQDTADTDMGMRPKDEDDPLGKSSRRTQVVERRDKNMTLEERRDYMQYLLSGRDSELDSDDEEFLEELGYPPESFGSSVSISDSNSDISGG